MRILIDTSKGMEYLHSHDPPVIHRDLKPSNLLIDKKWRAKIADFGVSKLKQSTQYKTQTLVGTPAYLAPEVIGKNLVTEKADVYSFGIVMIEVQSGIEPYHDMNILPQQVMYSVLHEGLRPKIPEDSPVPFLVLIEECIAEDSKKRPNFTEIKKRLKRLT